MEKKIEFKRKIEKKLYEWNNDPNKVPLIVDGLRQIGKSYIVDKFAHEEYENVIVYDFRHNKSLRKIFDGNLDVEHCKSCNVLAKVSVVIRKRHKYDVNGLIWRVYSFLWTNLLPVRRYLLALYRISL